MIARGLAVVTGAAGGLGSAYARELERRGYQLLLTDVDEERLAAVAATLPAAATLIADLARVDDQRRLADRLRSTEVELLINNAGFGTHSMFYATDINRQIDMVSVHVMASMRLAHAVLPGMIARGHGSIINVASGEAFMRFPRDSTYVGSKAFLVAFTECLAIELVGTGVTVQAWCPAWVRTDFATRGEFATVGYRTPIPDWLHISAEPAVRSSLDALARGSRTVMPSLRQRPAAWALGSRPGKAVLAFLRSRRR